WLDLFEERNEQHLSKYTLIQQLLDKIMQCNSFIIYSKIILNELVDAGYSFYELQALFKPYRPFLIYISYNQYHAGKARDLALKRNIPLADAFHALLAREHKAILVSRDRDFKRLLDIIVPKAPEELL
ncbi:MAG: PIN domain-containing protein, partial [Candidatus Woesearchaeota archaeon]|nr:PIN domain-containing protein [Candidatus Woesearchaeota archaeon]